MEFNATFIVSVISFIVFTILMNMVFYAPITKIKEERERIITDTINDAMKKQQEADKLIADKEERISAAAIESRKIISETIDKANKKSSKMTADARNESLESINEQKESLNVQAEEVTAELEQSAKVIADEITAKILG